MRQLVIVIGLVCSWLPFVSAAGEVRVAVAANFYRPMQQLVAEFEQQTDHRVMLSVGSSGKLFAQIRYNAPFDLFLSADKQRPEQLIKQQLAQPGSYFTYARGKLALWLPVSPTPAVEPGQLQAVLQQGKRLVIANPATAPYGTAAWQVIQRLGLEPEVNRKLITAQSIGQSFQFLHSGNVDMGFVALSQLFAHRSTLPVAEQIGGIWIVPESLYAPIEQGAVLLRRGRNNPAALALHDYLRSAAVQHRIQRWGYGTTGLTGMADTTDTTCATGAADDA